MNLIEKKFVAVLDDYTIRTLYECKKCDAMLVYAEQGHRCPFKKDPSVDNEEEAKELALLIARIIYGKYWCNLSASYPFEPGIPLHGQAVYMAMKS